MDELAEVSVNNSNNVAVDQDVDPNAKLHDLFRDAWEIKGPYKSISRVSLLEQNEHLLVDALKRDEIAFLQTLNSLHILGEELDPVTRKKNPGLYILNEYKVGFLARNIDLIKKRMDMPFSYKPETMGILSTYMSEEYRMQSAPLADFYIEQYSKGRLYTDHIRRKFFSFIFDVGNEEQMLGAFDELTSKLEEPLNALPGEARAKILGNLAGALGIKASPNLREKAQKLYGDELSKFGLVPKDILQSWADGIPVTEKEHLFQENLQAIYTLESIRPGVGIVNALWTEYGIADFGRYPIDALVWQYDHREDLDTPYGIAVYAKTDHNGAFYTQKNVLNTAFSGLQRLGYGMRIYEADKQRDIPRILVTADKKYGARNKISFAIIAGHGNTTSIQLGNGVDGQINLEKAMGRASFQVGRRLSALKNYFIKNPNIVLISCSTGAKSSVVEDLLRDGTPFLRDKIGIGHEISALGAKVKAPEEDAALIMLRVDLDEKGELVFNADYVRGDGSNKLVKTNEFHLGKVIK